MNGLEKRIYNTVLAYIGYGTPVKSTDKIREAVADILPLFDKENGVYNIQEITANLY